MPRAMAFAAGIATMLAWPISAGAADSDGGESGAETVEHCALELDTGTLVCAAHQSELATAMYEATGRVMVYGPETAAADSIGTQSTYVLGIVYSYPNYGGRSYTVSRSLPCSSAAFGYSDLGAIGWNDDIDSFKSYNGCQTKVWENTSYSGTSYGYASSSTDLGSMRNRASSIRWG